MICLSIFIRHRINIQKNALGVGHITLVSAAVQVADPSSLQVPCGMNGHGCLVVTAKDTGKVIIPIGKVVLEGVQAHLSKHIGKDILEGGRIPRSCHVCDILFYLTSKVCTFVIDVNGGILSDCGIVSTTI